MKLLSLSCTKFSFVLSGIVFVAIGVLSQPSYAVTSGCDPNKYADLQNVSEVRTAYDVGATEEIIPKPDSVLDLSCFSQASQVSSQNGVHTGNFTGNLNNVIQGATDNIGDNFDGGLMRENGFSKDAGWGGAGYSCDNMKDVWSISQSSGVDTDANFMDLDQILAASTATPPVATAAPGNIMEYNLTSSNAAATAVNASLAAAPTPIPVMDTDINANNRLDSCDVMRNLVGGPVAGC